MSAERVADNDLALLNRSIETMHAIQRQAELAEANHAFAMKHVAAVYKLGEGDVVAKDGTITRAKTDAAAPKV